MMFELKAIAERDVPEMNAWLSRCGLGKFMTGWIPRSVRQGQWRPELCRWSFIESAQQRIGTVWVERENDSETVAHLGILIAEAEHRGKGLGARVIQEVEREAASEWNVKTMRLRVRASNAGAVSCYRKAGYQVTEKTRRQDEQGPYEVLHMEHVLEVIEGGI